jgi:hypothetical protein
MTTPPTAIDHMSFHPVSEMFPLMKDADLALLVEDIRVNGLREPIWLHPDGRIIDGRNRHAACLRAGVEPETVEWNEAVHGDLIAFVLSRNVNRRHLSESQRAVAAAMAANMRQGERTDLAPIGGRSSQADAAAVLGASRRSTQRASLICNNGVRGLCDLVRDGLVTVGAASLVAKLPVQEQEDLLAEGPAAVKNRASRIREAPHEGGAPSANRNNAAIPEAPQAETTEPNCCAAPALPADLTVDRVAATVGNTATNLVLAFAMPVIVAEPNWRIPGLSQNREQDPGAVKCMDATSIRQRLDRFVQDVAGDNKALLLRVSPYLHTEARRVLEKLGFDHLFDIPVATKLAVSGSPDREGDGDYVLLGVQGDTAGLDFAALVRWLDDRRHAPAPTSVTVKGLAGQLSRGPILEVVWTEIKAGPGRG